ncbi:MAG: hypothetical protein H6899_09765 [Rhodobacter sp.]|nr:hypothetical protein [Rhodobacter sp.]
MSFEWMMPEPDAEHRVRNEEGAYLELLCTAAIEKGRKPILTFNRATARVQGIRSKLGGSTVLLTRCLAAQWASYLSLRQAGVDYFLRTAFRSIQQVLLNAVWRNNMKIFLPPNCDTSEQGLKELTMEEAWIAFVGMNLIHFAIAAPFIDLRIDIGRLSTDCDYARQTQRKLNEMLGKEVDLSGARMSLSFKREIHDLVLRTSLSLAQKLEIFIESNKLDVSTQLFLLELVTDINILCIAPRSDEEGPDRTVNLAERGLIAWKKRVQSRSKDSMDLEAKLDSLESSLFPTAFSFWTKPTQESPAND